MFTDPEIAWAGLTETEAKRQGLAVEVAQFPWAASGRALAIGRTEGLTKWLVDPATHRVLGCGVVGDGAGDLIAEAVVAIELARAFAMWPSRSIRTRRFPKRWVSRPNCSWALPPIYTAQSAIARNRNPPIANAWTRKKDER